MTKGKGKRRIGNTIFNRDWADCGRLSGFAQHSLYAGKCLAFFFNLNYTVEIHTSHKTTILKRFVPVGYRCKNIERRILRGKRNLGKNSFFEFVKSACERPVFLQM